MYKKKGGSISKCILAKDMSWSSDIIENNTFSSFFIDTKINQDVEILVGFGRITSAQSAATESHVTSELDIRSLDIYFAKPQNQRIVHKDDNPNGLILHSFHSVWTRGQRTQGLEELSVWVQIPNTVATIKVCQHNLFYSSLPGEQIIHELHAPIEIQPGREIIGFMTGYSPVSITAIVEFL